MFESKSDFCGASDLTSSQQKFSKISWCVDADGPLLFHGQKHHFDPTGPKNRLPLDCGVSYML